LGSLFLRGVPFFGVLFVSANKRAAKTFKESGSLAKESNPKSLLAGHKEVVKTQDNRNDTYDYLDDGSAPG